MNKYDDLKNKINKLQDLGYKLYDALVRIDEDSKARSYFHNNYQDWYSSALSVIKMVLPYRVDDFIIIYRNERRKKGVDVDSYTISDALRGITLRGGKYQPSMAHPLFLQQLRILESCLTVFESRLADIQNLLQADVFDSELDSAKHLKKKGFLRAAGAICGVILEKHLSSVCSNRNVTIAKKNKCLSDYNDALKDVAYDTNQWRKLQYLADIRNLCDHDKDREPSAEEIDDLIIGTDKVIKAIF